MKHATEDLTKLPQWAQNRIHKLEANIAWYQDQLKATNTPGSPVSWELSPDPDEIHGLPERATINFKTPDGIIEANLRGNAVVIRAYDGNIIIRPSAPNAVYVTADKRLGLA